MSNQTTRQTENKAYIVGVLKEKKIEFRPSKTSNKLMAIGTLTVVTNTPVGVGEVVVKVQQFAEKKDGKPNTLFKGLQTVQNTYKSIEEFGEENADLIKIEGQLEDGTYYSANKGDFVEKLELKGVFVNRLTDKNTPHCCKVGFEGFISKITPVNEELEVEMIGIGYNGIAVPVSAMIPNNLVAPFQGRYTVGCTATLNFAIINEVEVKAVQTETAFGESLGETIERHTVKRIIFGGGNPIYMGTPNAITEEMVKQGLAIRESKLEESKNRVGNSTAGTTMQNGFAGAEAGVGAFGTPMQQGVPQAGAFGGFPQGVFTK